MDLTLLGLFTDFNFVLKIFFILTVIAFVRRRVTHNKLSLFLITIAVIGFVFLYWPIFGIGYALYILITVGIGTVLVDFFFVSSGKQEKYAGKSQGKKAMETKANTPGTPGRSEHLARHNAMRGMRR